MNTYFQTAVWPMIKLIKPVIFCLLGALAIKTSHASTFSLPSEGNVIGEPQHVVMKRGETLLQMAQRYDIGTTEITKANPGIGLQSRYSRNVTVNIPSQYVLPEGPREGLVLNLADLRIYYFHPDEPLVSTYPVGVGKQGWSTPTGNTNVKAKERNPAWRPPPSIHREAARGGRTLPLVVPPGPRNPLGKYAIRLAFSAILIHGTPQPGSVGTRCSHGCIRMFAKSLEDLFNKIPIGTIVRIVHEPKKTSPTSPKI
jgi:L,D-transpeptidase ErfK/SrfK